MLNNNIFTSSFFSKVFSFDELFFVRQLLVRLSLILFIYFILRVVFLAVHWEAFQTVYFTVTTENIFWIFFTGTNFDLIVIIFINIPIIITHLMPSPWRKYSAYPSVLRIAFITINAIFIFIGIADIIYYQHAMERASGAIFGVLDGFWLLFYRYSVEYWYALLFFILIIIILYWVDRKIEEDVKENTTYSIQFLLLILFAPIIFLVASKITNKFPTNTTAAATNTPFILINDMFTSGSLLNDQNLPEHSFFKPGEAEDILKIQKNYHRPEKSENSFNVMIIVLESFSKQYIGYFQEGQSHTPFIDSLYNKSFVFTNAFANGNYSNEAISSIYTSIPALMRQPMITSRYKYNDMNGIASLLGGKGYNSAFFMGSPNGLFGYDFFTKRAGFEEYFGKSEYNNNTDYDGAWGIYDDRFFRFTAEKLDEMEQPFMASLWSLSSHHPFLTPPDYQDNLEEAGDHPILKTIRYTDHSLNMFFEKIQKMPWFNNTLFVITADHKSNTNNHTAYYSTPLGAHRIPLIFYKPGSDLTGVNHEPVQHIDILPSVMDYLNQDVTFSSMGKSVFDPVDNRFVYQYYNRLFQISDDTFFLQYDGEQIISLYNHRKDSLMQNNLLFQQAEIPDMMLKTLKANMQYYNRAMNENEFVKREN
ncbi:MAG: LTA synthase family protein [Balneolales bacterium]